MEHTTVLNIILGVISTIAATLLGKFFWDRYLAQASRVTRREFEFEIKRLEEECALKRKPCLQARESNKAYFESLILQQKGCLDEAFEEEGKIQQRRAMTRQALVCIMLTQLKICNALKKQVDPDMDCSDISKMLVEMGAIE